MDRKTLADITERVVWTLLQAILAVVTVDALNVPVQWVPLVAMALAAVKSVVATKVGDPRTAATLPAQADTPVALDELDGP